MRKILAPLVLLLALVGCGTSRPAPPSYEAAAYAGALCVDGSYYRVPDHYCPIGDAPVEGSPYFWTYQEYRAEQPDIDVVYVGYPVDRTRWVNVRPARVETLHIQRGDYPERPPAGQPATERVRVTTLPARQRPAAAAPATRAPATAAAAPTRNPDIQRGGLGVPSARGTTNTGTPVGAQATQSARPNPPAPATRVSAPSTRSSRR